MTRPRGRPKRKEGPVITRKKLLEIAVRIIGRDGFEGASMRGIASAANVSLATLQNHFKTKESLWKAVIDELLVPILIGRSKAEHENPEAGLLAAIASILEAVVSRPGLSGRLLTDASPAGEERLQYLAQATESIRQADRNKLKLLRENGDIRNIDINAILILGGIALSTLSSSRTAVRLLIGPDLDDNEERAQIVTAITDILLYGLLPR
jgi:AcrR family transcriptional regulator